MSCCWPELDRKLSKLLTNRIECSRFEANKQIMQIFKWADLGVTPAHLLGKEQPESDRSLLDAKLANGHLCQCLITDRQRASEGLGGGLNERINGRFYTKKSAPEASQATITNTENRCLCLPATG